MPSAGSLALRGCAFAGALPLPGVDSYSDARIMWPDIEKSSSPLLL